LTDSVSRIASSSVFMSHACATLRAVSQEQRKRRESEAAADADAGFPWTRRERRRRFTEDLAPDHPASVIARRARAKRFPLMQRYYNSCLSEAEFLELRRLSRLCCGAWDRALAEVADQAGEVHELPIVVVSSSGSLASLRRWVTPENDSPPGRMAAARPSAPNAPPLVAV
jgi:hypothetical protein